MKTDIGPDLFMLIVDATKVHLFLNYMYSVCVQLVTVTMMRFVGI